MKKTQGSKKITLHKETLLRLQPESVDLRETRVVGATGWCSEPSCDYAKQCTLRDCISGVC